MEPPDIERLDERTVQRIAAGEVVERPASVVKELIENSLDAGASRVAVSVEAGGAEGVRVRDDGVGIPEGQLEAAVAEHATSKIGDIEDLDRGVGTLGFRGEALYTVGAVSRLTVRSRPPDAAAGAEIRVDGGDVGEVRPAGCPTGTTVEVDDLFYNTPARKKFLKQTATEFDRVNTVVTGYALANPGVAVSLEHDGRETFATEGNGDLRSAVLAVYGREVAEAMIDVDWTPPGDESLAENSPPEDSPPEDSPPEDSPPEDSPPEDSPVRAVSGLISHPETTRASREYLATYVNGRYVTASALREAVLEAYGGQLAPDRYPFAVLFVDVPPGDVDVNVHPRKLEVRFDEEPAVRAAVKEAVEAALIDRGLIRSTAPRGRSAPEQTEIRPESAETEAVGGAGTDHERAARRDRDDDDASESGDADESAESGSATGEANATTATELDPADESAWAVGDVTADDGPDPSASATDRSVETVDTGGSSDSAAAADSANAASADSETATPPSRTGRPSPATGESEAGDDRDADATRPETDAESPDGRDRFGASAASDQHTLAGEPTSAERTYDSLPSLRVLGQLHETYVVAEAPDGLVLIDQHAADERVNYERLQRVFADGADAQALAEPVRIELTAREAALFEEFGDDLAAVGFRAERAGEREVVVKSVPAVFDAAFDPSLLRDVLSALVGDAGAGEEPVTDVVDELLADLACYPSVTGNTSLTEGSVVDLLDRLDDCENPYACPHGRPVVIRLDREEIGSRFERDYPGHAGRRAE
ncbi:DNA mismatch repair endonuclease MutL [Halorubrum sp. PV6]|uniref:DNA mismatch repair endonuclease MutL n=1 Tax=Halorubrum sp. PV6 TaxID=634157 RepID=UPI000F85835B|nr:DNA mismatch repair endonuclease MutL [Halorubrum sp. PV6]AZQ13873.1 DNA mismatch repair endonuclease MutL [Halorubrum sp. PV6]